MTSTDTSVRSRSSRRGDFRPDIEGMRAIAIGLVLIYHAGVRQLPGGFVGVDVFFVISGFLITGLLIREIEKDGRISLRRFYARRAKRLLPATGVVLVVTAALTWVTTSVIHWRDFGLDIVASAVYLINWRLADRSVDYLAEDMGVSPVQHFWSLAVEEQFYIVWPLFMVGLAWWLRRSDRGGHERPIHRVLLGGIFVVIVPSFAYSVYLTTQDPALAFFVTPTRLWELGIGALLALGVSTWRLVPRPVAITLGWAGFVAVIASAFLVDASTPWPGYAALAPTLGTAAMIVAGYTSGPAGPAGILSWRPAVWVGALSYSLYLWHWPLVVAATNYWGELGAQRGLLIVAFSVLPAYLCYRLVENPIRFSSNLSKSHGRTGLVGLAFTAIGVIAGLLLVAGVPSTNPGQEQADDAAPALGAAVLAEDPGQGTIAALDAVQWYTPAPTEAEDDLPRGYAEECQVRQSQPEPDPCEWGDPEGEVTIAVVGDSKILQWQSALEEIALDQGWRIIAHTKSACGFHAGMQARDDGPYTQCAEWNEAVLAEMIDLAPDAVLTSQGAEWALADPEDPDSRSTEAMVQALSTQWAALAEHDIPVVVLLDNPAPPLNVYECVADHADALHECAFDLNEGLESSASQVQLGAAQDAVNTSTIDMEAWICPEDPCVPIIGNVLIYRQGSHLTDTYVRTLREQLATELIPHIGEESG